LGCNPGYWQEGADHQAKSACRILCRHWCYAG